MSRRKKYRSNSGPGFVALSWELLNSRAYRGLGSSASKALPYFLGKPKIIPMNKEAYTVTFEFSYSEAEKYGFSTATFSRIIKELVDKGFINPITRGGLKGKGRSCSQYRLSTRWKDYDLPCFVKINWKEFIHTGASINS